MVSAVGRSEERRGGGGRKIDISGGKAGQEERVCITCSFHIFLGSIQHSESQ